MTDVAGDFAAASDALLAENAALKVQLTLGVPAFHFTPNMTGGLAALLTSPDVPAGSRIVLHGGIYQGQFVASISGTPEKPIRIEPYDNTPVVIEGGLTINGADTVWVNLELRGDWQAYPRTTTQVVNHISIFGARTKFINCTIHDVAQVGWWAPAEDSELYGCLIFNCGVTGTNVNKWHAIYTQNAAGLKRLTHCIVLPGYSEYGIHAYAEGGSVRGYRFHGVIHVGKRWQIGGIAPFADVEIAGCITHLGNIRIGYVPASLNADITLTGNDFASHVALVAVSDWQMHDNRFHSVAPNGAGILSVNWYAAHSESIDGNHYTTPSVGGSLFSIQGNGNGFSQWRALGYDATGSWVGNSSGVDSVAVQSNAYDAKRRTLIVRNWSGAAEVSMDAALAGLANGQAYTLRNAYDPLNDVHEFVSDGTLRLDFTTRTVASPTGAAAPLQPLDPRFGIWLLEAA